MEKTWEIREQELRGEIAQVIELAIEGLMPPVDEVEEAVYHSLTWAAGVARGDNASS
jgi:hypothetical protein